MRKSTQVLNTGDSPFNWKGKPSIFARGVAFTSPQHEAILRTPERKREIQISLPNGSVNLTPELRRGRL